MRGFVLGLAGLWALALADLMRPGEPEGADALWTWLESLERGEDAERDRGTDARYIDAARELSRVRPWQDGYSVARQRRAEVEAARLQALHR